MHLLTKFLDWLFPWTIKDWPKELAERCDIGVTADEQAKSFADAERIVPIKLDWNTGTAPKKKVKKVTKKKKTSKKKRK